jgi:hypothetical protein
MATMPPRFDIAYHVRCRWCCLRLHMTPAIRRQRQCRRRYNIGPLDGKSASWNVSIARSIGTAYELTFVNHVGGLWIDKAVKKKKVIGKVGVTGLAMSMSINEYIVDNEAVQVPRYTCSIWGRFKS